jgi:hypothetical protein
MGKYSNVYVDHLKLSMPSSLEGEFNEETLSPKVDGDHQLEREKVYSYLNSYICIDVI